VHWLGTHRRSEKCIQILVGKPRRRDNFLCSVAVLAEPCCLYLQVSVLLEGAKRKCYLNANFHIGWKQGLYGRNIGGHICTFRNTKVTCLDNRRHTLERFGCYRKLANWTNTSKRHSRAFLKWLQYHELRGLLRNKAKC
jgi:hypothetical protein